MKRLRFDDIEEFCFEVLNKYTELDKDEFEDISIIAKYEEAKDIISELICIGFNVHSIDIHDKEWDRYSSEYIISLCNCDSDHDLFCEPMKRGDKYISDEATVTYILDNCSSRVIDCCEGEIIYEISVGIDEDYDEYEYDCANCDLDECPRCGELEDDDSECDDTEDKNAYTITIKCNLDTDEAEKIIADMENRVEHMNNMFAEMDMFRRMFRW